MEVLSSTSGDVLPVDMLNILIKTYLICNLRRICFNLLDLFFLGTKFVQQGRAWCEKRFIC